MARIPILDENSNFNPVQRRVVDGILGRRGGRIPGPYRLSLHAPEVTEVWHPLGEKLRLNSSFPLHQSEFAILITARCWDCDYVFNAHAKIATDAGLAQGIVDAMGHISARHPDNPKRYLLSWARSPGLVEPEDIMEFDLEGKPVKDEGKPNDLYARLAGDAEFGVPMEDLVAAADPSRFVGRAPQQVDDFLAEVVAPWLATAASTAPTREDVRV